MLGLGLNLTSITAALLDFVRSGLKMWLPFENSEILGEDVIVNGDFATGDTTGWNKSGNPSNYSFEVVDHDGKIDALHFTTTDAGAGVNQIALQSNKQYLVKFDLKVISGNVLVGKAGNYVTGGTLNPSEWTSYEEYWTPNDAYFRIYSYNAGAQFYVDNVSVQEVTQIAPDKSGNSNGATLYTGKALSFDGTGDSYYVDFGNTGVGLKTLAFWINLDSTTEKVLQLTSTQSIEVSSGTITLNGTWTGSAIYVDATATSTIAASNWKRVVITTTSAITVNDLELGRIGSSYGDFILSDLQIFDSVWTQADVTFDYENPQHLVTDRTASSIALSNLKGYWHLSEGDGSSAYNSAVALGSDVITDGTFPNSNNWTEDSEWTISGNTLNKDGSTDNNTRQLISSPVGKYYQITYTISNYVKGSFKPVFGYTNLTARSGNDTYTEVGQFAATSGTFKNYLRLYSVGDSEYSISNVILKEVSVGTINGATWVPRQATIPQLGLMDWAKSTPVADEITLISDPNDPSKDILGNSVRLREHSLNLDGSGYAEVADDDSLDFGTGAFSIDGWAKYTFVNSGSNRGNVIFINGGNPVGANSGSFAILTNTEGVVRSVNFYVNGTNLSKNITSSVSDGAWFYFAGTRDADGNLKLYINDLTVASLSQTGNSDETVSTSLARKIGRGSDTTRYYKNLIDDVRLYKAKELSADEVGQNYKAGLSQHKTGSAFSDDFSSDYGL